MALNWKPISDRPSSGGDSNRPSLSWKPLEPSRPSATLASYGLEEEPTPRPPRTGSASVANPFGFDWGTADNGIAEAAQGVSDTVRRTGRTVTGAGSSFVDRLQSQVGGLLERAAGTAADIYESQPIGLAPVAEGLRAAQRTGSDIAVRNAQEAAQTRQQAEQEGAYGLGMDFLGALGDVSLQVAASLATRSPGVGAGVAAGQIYGPEYAARLAEGQSKEDAAAGALARAGSEIGTVVPTMGLFTRLFGQGAEAATNRLVRNLEGSRAGRGLLGGVAEGSQEAAANVVGQAVDYNLGFSDTPFADAGETAYEGGLGGAVGSLLGALSPGRRRVVQTGDPDIDAGAQAAAEAQDLAGVEEDAFFERRRVSTAGQVRAVAQARREALERVQAEGVEPTPALLGEYERDALEALGVAVPRTQTERQARAAQRRQEQAQLEQISVGDETGKVANNASNESPISKEAIERMKQEAALGRTRAKIMPDGRLIPFVTADAVDFSARPGEIIVQKGIGSDPNAWVVLDSNGIPDEFISVIVNRRTDSLNALQAELAAPGGDIAPEGEVTIEEDSGSLEDALRELEGLPPVEAPVEAATPEITPEAPAAVPDVAEGGVAPDTAFSRIAEEEGITDPRLASAQIPSRMRDMANRVARSTYRLVAQRGGRSRDLAMLEEERQGKIAAASYQANVQKNRLADAARMEGVSMDQINKAMVENKTSALPEQTRNIARQIQLDKQLNAMRLIEAEMALAPPDKKLSRGLRRTVTAALNNPGYFNRIYRINTDRRYATDMIRRVQQGNGTEQENKIVTDVLDYVESSVLIPENLADRYAAGEVDRKDLVDYHRKWLGSEFGGKTNEQLVEELSALRDRMAQTEGGKDGLAMFALRTIAGDINKQSPGLANFFRGARKDESILKERGLPRAIRRLWGEYEDAAINTVNTIQQQASLIAQNQMLNELSQTWAQKGWLTDSPQGNNTEQLTGETFGPLQGKFTTLNNKELLNSIVEVNNAFVNLSDAIASRDASAIASASARAGVAGIQRLAAYTKANAIIGRPANWSLNLIGSPEQLVANGNIPILNGTLGIRGLERGISGILGTLQSSRRRSENPYTTELFKAGVVESAQVQDIRNALKNDKISESLQNSSTALQLEQRLDGFVDRGIISITEAYAIMDLWVPAVNYFYNRDTIQAHWDKIGREYTEDQLIREAADMTKLTSVTNKYVPSVVRATESVGLTYVLPYLYSSFRSYSYGAFVGSQQIVEGVKTGDLTYARVGLMRLAGSAAAQASFMARVGMIPAMIGAAGFSYLADSDDEEEQAILRAAGVDDRMDTANPVLIDKRGTSYFLFDGNRFYPQEPPQIAVSQAVDLLAAAANGDQDVGERAEAFGSYMADQFFWNAGMVKVALGLFGKEPPSKLRREAREYYDGTVGDNRILQRAQSLIETLTPSGISDAWASYLRSQTERATPPTVDALKRLGFQVVEINPAEDLTKRGSYFNGINRYMREFDDSLRSFKRTTDLLVDVPETRLERSYLRFARQNMESYQNLVPMIDAARAQGATPRQIENLLKDTSLRANQRKAFALGYYELPEITDDFFKGARDRAAREASGNAEKQAEWDAMFRQRLQILRAIRRNLQSELDNHAR